jgi:4-amino-4-deoxy-L-arabinose transferase-like glycosyltransferase
VSAGRSRVALAGILALAAALNFVHIARNGYANTYYAGAVRSMLSSWHLFLWTSFDRGGLVSVDKPPLGLWVEALSAKVFGFSGPAILLPEGLAGIGAVWVLYLLVARHFGRVAGLAAALALAVSPVSVAVDRDNNLDALFVFLLVCAAWAGARAVEQSRLRWLLASAAFVGLAFETKLLVAAFVVPGLALAYLLFARLRLATRLVHLLAAAGVLLVVGGAWIAAIELTPAADRPWLGSTGDNSAISLLFGYNGFGRVDGQTGGTSSNGIGGVFSGTPGAFRLLNDALGDQIAWLLPLAIVGGCSAVAWAWRRRREQAGPLLILSGWFITAAAVLSVSAGIVHTYYVSALAPAASALAGIGAVSLFRDARRTGAWIGLPLLAVVFAAWLQVTLLDRSDYRSWLVEVVVAATVVAAAGLLALAFFPDWRHRGAVAAAALAVALAGFLAPPAAWAQSTLTTPVNGVFPGAGPNFQGRRFGLGFALGAGTGDLAAALAYAEAHRPGSRFALIVSSEEEAADSVVAGKKVAAMGGFTGRETVLAPSYVAGAVARGEARYFLLGRSTNPTIERIESVCTPVSWSGRGLYDCAGKAALLGE